MELYVLFGTFTFLLLIGTPVAFCLGVSSFATIASGQSRFRSLR
jgi:hypothetical protein